MFFATSAPGYEPFLEKEAQQYGLASESAGDGWRLFSQTTEKTLADPDIFCFSHAIMPDVIPVSGSSVNAITSAVADYFCASIKDEHVDSPWPLCIWNANAETPASRVHTALKVLNLQIRKRMSRVARLAHSATSLAVGPGRGLYVCFTSPGTAYVSRTCFGGGQQRMKDDPRAPSRSYLKVEEAYRIMGRHPAPGETVADLGAAPGGWSYSAALRGAHVAAVDNGPLKAGALDNPCIEHRREDAFTFAPKPREKYDWLFCDMVEDPYRIIDLIRKWGANGWSRSMIVNFKFGRTDPVKLLDVIRDDKKGLPGLCSSMRIRHLYHDREEFTVMGEIREK